MNKTNNKQMSKSTYTDSLWLLYSYPYSNLNSRLPVNNCLQLIVNLYWNTDYNYENNPLIRRPTSAHAATRKQIKSNKFQGAFYKLCHACVSLFLCFFFFFVLYYYWILELALPVSLCVSEVFWVMCYLLNTSTRIFVSQDFDYLLYFVLSLLVGNSTI